jgi:hypothetical protein
VRISWQWRCGGFVGTGRIFDASVGDALRNRSLERLELDDVLKLPATMDVARARAVFDDLFATPRAPADLDASEVEKASALAIEV